MEKEILWISILAASVFALLCLSIIYFVVTYQRRRTILEQENRDLELKFQLEIERVQNDIEISIFKEIGRELHDNISQNLGIINLYGSNPRTTDAEYRAKTYPIVQIVLEEVRQLSKGMNAFVSSNISLSWFLEQQFERLNDLGINATLSYEIPSSYKDPKVEILFIRVVQELIQNTLKHAKAKQISLHMGLMNNAIIIEYSDNGIGFDKNDTAKGQGINNIQDRILQLNGHVDIRSAIGNGFNAYISIPLPHDN